MKHAKTLALTAVAAGALMAFIGAGTASATVICSTAVEPCPAGQKWPINMVLELTIPSGVSSLVKETGAEGGTVETCTESKLKGSISNGGSSTTTVTGPITELTWGHCTFPRTTTLLGKLEVHKTTGGNGTVTADGETRVTINTVLFGSCIYTVPSGKTIGEITEGKPAIFHINAITEKATGSEFACPPTLVWTSTYTLTSPANTTLYVAAS